MSDAERPANWRIILAFVLGYAIGALTGNLTPTGFQLNGGPALVLFAAIIAYFWLDKRFGWRIWRRLLKA